MTATRNTSSLKQSSRREVSAAGVVWGMAVVAIVAVGAIACSPHPDSPTAAPPTTQQSQGDVSPAGDIPDNQAFVAFTPADRSFTVKVPEGWARTDSAGVIAFTDKLNTIEIESRPATTAPTVESVNANDIPAIAAHVNGFQPGVVTAEVRRAGDVVLVTYRADSAPNPVTGKVTQEAVERYAFYRPGQQATITLSGPVGADNIDPWRTVTDSFAWTP